MYFFIININKNGLLSNSTYESPIKKTYERVQNKFPN